MEKQGDRRRTKKSKLRNMICEYLRSLLVDFVVEGEDGARMSFNDIIIAFLNGGGADTPSVTRAEEKRKEMVSALAQTRQRTFMR